MRRRATVTLAVTVLAATTTALAGDLNPPAGPVAPTMKRLDQVEPRIAINFVNTPGDAASLLRITQPGSYYLTGNVTGVAGKNGIFIAASNVTIDLNGFSLNGVSGSLKGILGGGANWTIRNGTVRAWGQDGIGVANELVVEHVAALGNGATGISAGLGARITGCTAVGNSADGIRTFTGSVVLDCVANNNVQDGIEAGDGSIVLRCSALDNANGVFAAAGCTVESCTARANASDGIHADERCTIRANTCSDNGDDGIQVGSTCQVLANTCNSNGPFAAGAGVFVTGGLNRIEDNHVNQNDRGLLISGGENFVVRNTARNNNTNFAIGPSNDAAPVLLNPGANGFAGATPWSNFAY